MTQRQRAIVELAETFTEAQNPLNGPHGVRGDGGGVIGMSDAWKEGSYEEFEWCLGYLRKNAKQKAHAGINYGKLWWHIVHWWINVERVQRWEERKRKTRKGVLTKVEPVIVIRRHPDAREAKALLGVEVIDAVWPEQGRPPQVPVKAWERMAA